MYGSFDRPTLALAAALSVGLGLILEAATLPDGSRFRGSWPDTTSYMKLRLEQAQEEGRRLDLRYRPVRSSQIGGHLRRAVRVAEDASFYQHPGIDIHEVTSAVAEAWRERRSPRGASTITQQLARNLYLSPDRSLTRKAREAVIALRMESELSKERILELYLNVVELGEGVFGVQPGSVHYFGLPPDRLSRRQAAMLAATIPSPRSDNPSTRTREFRWRTELIFRRAFGVASTADTAAAGSPTLSVPKGVDALPAGDSVRQPDRDSLLLPPPDSVGFDPEGAPPGRGRVPPPSRDTGNISGFRRDLPPSPRGA